MKVGIITLFGDNYGNKLQNYALQELLKELGCEVSTIVIKNGLNYPFQETVIEKIKKVTPWNIYRSLISRFNVRFHRKNQSDGFIKSIRECSYTDYSKIEKSRTDSFHSFSNEHLNVTEYIIDENKEYPTELEDFDFFVVGSDQVWNRTRSSYFLQFAPQTKRVTFAPSFGMSSLPRYLIQPYTKWLNEFPTLSVREETGKAIIKDLTGRVAELMPDPTLCVQQHVWNSIEIQPADIDEDKFVLTYFLGNETNKYRRFIEVYARENKCRVINLYDIHDPTFYATSPSEFVWLIHNAEAVFTDSFHATVFSIIFHTPFVVFDRVESGGTSMGSRLDTLLGLFDFQNRRYGKVTIGGINNIIFDGTDVTMCQQRERAILYLKKALRIG